MVESEQKQALYLRASASAWRLYSARKSDPRFAAFEKKVWQRDHYTCQFCGFQARKYQDVVNLDGNFSNNRLANMVTSCCFCAQCFFLESVGVGGYGGGTLVYLPEMSQEKLNGLCHVLFCAITNNTGYKSIAQSIYRSLKFRAEPVEKKYGEGTSDPSVLGQLIIDSGIDQHTEKLSMIFSNVRLLPSRAKFRKQIEHWAAAAVAEIGSD
ncbi:MAG: type IVB secretion system protein IcmJDotN [Legionellaceae bacterium]|nr:type IVB secretion system protein IcmJDotN [Legionellaceae bacterium]